MRLDLFISEKFGFTRNKAKQCIESGLAEVNGRNITKVSFDVSESDIVSLIEDKSLHWVSRSAGKLDGFLGQLLLSGKALKIMNTHCLDVGSSTGGFTQVLLDRGARHVDAVDVGTDQLHESIRKDARVTSYEQTDIRKFETKKAYDIIVCDASFISLQDILLSILELASKDTHMILLWKPQFEVGREHLRKSGVPKDEKVVLKKQQEWEKFLEAYNCKILQKEKSIVIGEAGNEEWLYSIQKS